MAGKSMKSKQRLDRPEHHDELQRRAEEFISTELSLFESEQMSQSLQEQFLEYVAAFEQAEWVSNFDQLVLGGMELPEPDLLDDAQLSVKLWEVIHGLAMLRTFLYSTDHLSDRELYEELWHDVLREENPEMPLDADSACHIDLLGGGSERDIELYLRYYADEETRNDWAQAWPDDPVPPHEPPPYDRDRYLPSRFQAEWQSFGTVS